MVVMEVGDQDRVEVGRRLAGGRRALAAEVHQPRAQNRVGEEPHAVELEQHRRVPDVGDAILPPNWSAPTHILMPMSAKREGSL